MAAGTSERSVRASQSLNADDVARRSFPNAFRGYDPDQVRLFLGQVAAELAGAQERERLLLERVAAAEAQAAAVPVQLGEAELVAAVGKEAARVLAAAKQAAVEIRASAEEHVARLHREARDEAARLRSESERLLDQRNVEAEAVAAALRADADAAAQETRAEGEAQAAAAIEAAQGRGREMVREAQAVRERILRDMARRRRTAHGQLEQLRVGRERLLESYAVVRATVEEATAELAVAEVEARAEAQAAALEPVEESEPTLEDLEAEVAAARREPAVPPAAVTEPEPAAEPEPEVATEEAAAPAPTAATPAGADEPDADDGAVVIDLRETALDADQGGAQDRPDEVAATDDRLDPALATVPEPATPEPAAGGVRTAQRRTSALRILGPPPSSVPDETAPAPPRPHVDDLFARLRADREASVASARAVLARSGVEGAASAEDDAEHGAAASSDRAEEVTALLVARDEAVERVARELARALKRELADEQNAVLDALRRSRGRPSLDDLLPEGDGTATRYATAARRFLGVNGDDLADDLGAELAGALRAGVVGGLEETGGDHAGMAERVSGLYREWKSTRIEPLARHAALGADGQERRSVASSAQWLVDPSTSPCPECEGNAAAGPAGVDDAFPSGAAHPPAHPGCRCLVVAADS